MSVSRRYNPNRRRSAEFLQAELTKVGLGAEIVSFEWGEYFKWSSDPAHDSAMLAGWTANNGDADCFLTSLLSALPSVETTRRRGAARNSPNAG